MPFVPVANTVMAEIRQLLDGQKVENTLYFQNATSLDAAEMTALGDALVAWWTANITPLQGQDVLLREVYLTDLTSASSMTHTRPVVPNIPGGVASPSLPNNVTITTSFRSAGRGRFSRGRNYFVGLTEGQVLQNEVSIAFADELADAYNALLTALPAGFTWVVVSKSAGGVPRASGYNSPVVAALVVDTVIDGQRRRLPGRGR